jgi:hypothetical protein
MSARSQHSNGAWNHRPMMHQDCFIGEEDDHGRSKRVDDRAVTLIQGGIATQAMANIAGGLGEARIDPIEVSQAHVAIEPNPA